MNLSTNTDKPALDAHAQGNRRPSSRAARSAAALRLGKPSVAVFDADAPPALAFVRSVGRRGAPVHVHAAHRFSVARFSRYVATRREAPPVDDASEFLPFLIEQLRSESIDLVAPTSDLVAFYLSCVYELLGPRMRAVLPSREAILDALLKDRFHARCEMLGQATPHTLCPTSLTEAMDLSSEIAWPVILKPRSHVGVGLARGVLITNRDELAREFKPYVITKGNLPIVEHAPAIRWPLIQEYIPDALQNLYSVSGLLGKNGEVIAASSSRKSTQWPPNLGVGTSFTAHDDTSVTELGVNLARQILGRGIFEIELIHDRRHDRWVAIDLNPRAFGQISLDIARGHDLPGLWYRMALGEKLACQEAPAADVRWLHAIPFHVGHWIGLIKGPSRARRLSGYAETFKHRHVDVVHDQRDPLPSLVFMAKMLRHPGGLVRPFLSGRF